MELWFLGTSVVALLIALVFARAAAYIPPEVSKEKPIDDLDRETSKENLAGALKIKTVSYEEQSDFEEFERFYAYIEKRYPHVFSAAKKERVLEHGILLEIPGENGAIVLMGHYDVVPAEGEWEYPAFGAEEHDGYVYARGALDMKGQVIAMLEALEYHLKKGAKPKKTVYVWLGFDEEISSAISANAAAQLLKSRGVRADYVIDECGGFIDGEPFNVDGLIALIGVCEKGYADVRVSSEGTSGHSSMPPKKTALGCIAEGINRLQNKPPRDKLTGTLKSMVMGIAPYMRGTEKMFFANIWLFFPWVKDLFRRIPMGGAWLRTTYAPTMASASNAPNVLPSHAEAVINVRILPGESVEKAVKRISLITGLKTDIIAATEPTPVSPMDSPEFKNIVSAVEKTFGVPAVPSINVMATDSRFFYCISDNVYRFVPFPCVAEDVETMHSENERIKLDSFWQGIEFFIRLLEKDMDYGSGGRV